MSSRGSLHIAIRPQDRSGTGDVWRAGCPSNERKLNLTGIRSRPGILVRDADVVGGKSGARLRAFVEYEALYGADIEWILRLVDYAVQNIILEHAERAGYRAERRPYRGRIGRFAPELGKVSLRVESVRTGRSLELLFSIWGELPNIAATLSTIYLLSKAYFWLRDRRHILRGKGIPLLPKVTIEGITTSRIRTIRITLEIPRRRREEFDYIRNQGYR